MSHPIHIIGAGLAGLASAVRLAAAGKMTVVHEAANQAGGRCRSYHDPALDMMIDNGNHLLLSGNRATMSYLHQIGARDRLSSPANAAFPFIDLTTNERWTLRLNSGRLPWWIFDGSRRAPNTQAIDYLSLLRLLWAGKETTVCDLLNCTGLFYDRIVRPIFLAALNTDPSEASARLAGAVLRETLARGGGACLPLIATEGLADALVNPALDFIQAKGGTVRLGRRLRSILLEGKRATALDFGEETVRLEQDDAIILAVPPVVAADLLPGLQTPTEFRAIVNAHFRFAPPADLPPMTAAVNGMVEWLFAFPNRLSVTISGADRLLDVPREELAQQIWNEVGRIADVADLLPRWQIVRERRATFAALPKEDAKRPRAETAWGNVILAGDWTATGLPATIESAIRSGHRAADLVSQMES